MWKVNQNKLKLDNGNWERISKEVTINCSASDKIGTKWNQRYCFLILRKIFKLHIKDRLIKSRKKCLIALFISRNQKEKKIAVKVNCLDPYKKTEHVNRNLAQNLRFITFFWKLNGNSVEEKSFLPLQVKIHIPRLKKNSTLIYKF